MKSIGFIFIVLWSLPTMSQEGWDLQKCVQYAIDHNIDVQSQLLQNELNLADYQQAQNNILPNLNAGISHGYNWGQRIDPFTNRFASERVRSNNLNLNSNVGLYNGMRLQNQKKQAALSVTAGALDVEQTKNDISLTVAQFFLNNILAEEQLEVSENQKAITIEQLERMKKLVAGGQEPKAKQYELEAQLAADDLNVINNENSITLNRLSLINLLQLQGEEAKAFSVASPTIKDEEVTMPTINAEELYQSALSNLPEVKAADLRNQQSQLDVSIAKSFGLPSLSLFGSIGSGYSGANKEGVGTPIAEYVPLGQVGIGGPTVFSLQEQTFYDEFQTKQFGDQLDQNFNQSVGLSLNIPIFNNGNAKIAKDKARIGMEMAALNTQRVQNKLSADTQQAYANAMAALSQYLSAEKSSVVLRRNFDNAKTRFENGLISTTEFNSAKIQWQNQQMVMLQAKYEYIFRTKIMEVYQGKPIQ